MAIEEPAENPQEDTTPEESGLEQFIATDRVRLEIGSAIIPLTSVSGNTSLPERIAVTRRELTRKYGMWIPTVRLRDCIACPLD